MTTATIERIVEMGSTLILSGKADINNVFEVTKEYEENMIEKTIEAFENMTSCRVQTTEDLSMCEKGINIIMNSVYNRINEEG